MWKCGSSSSVSASVSEKKTEDESHAGSGLPSFTSSLLLPFLTLALTLALRKRHVLHHEGHFDHDRARADDGELRRGVLAVVQRHVLEHRQPVVAGIGVVVPE